MLLDPATIGSRGADQGSMAAISKRRSPGLGCAEQTFRILRFRVAVVFKLEFELVETRSGEEEAEVILGKAAERLCIAAHRPLEHQLLLLLQHAHHAFKRSLFPSRSDRNTEQRLMRSGFEAMMNINTLLLLQHAHYACKRLLFLSRSG